MKRYAILDLTNFHMVKVFEDRTKAKEALYDFRKQRYIEEHPDRPAWEYDTMKHDNGYNLIEYKVIA